MRQLQPVPIIQAVLHCDGRGAKLPLNRPELTALAFIP